MGKFRNKYRIPSARAPFWNYSQQGLYYITICSFHRETIFGKIVNKTMVLSPIGEIVSQEWNKSFDIRQELFCYVFVIMPNHLHAILRIDDVETHDHVETHGRASLITNHGIAYRSPKSISSFVAGVKSTSTKQINEFRRSTGSIWQPRFHDHIIRNDEDYQRIWDYIINNPSKWQDDEFFQL